MQSDHNVEGAGIILSLGNLNNLADCYYVFNATNIRAQLQDSCGPYNIMYDICVCMWD